MKETETRYGYHDVDASYHEVKDRKDADGDPEFTVFVSLLTPQLDPAVKE